MLAQRPEGLVINMSVTLYSFQPLKPIQFSLFNSSIQEEEALSKSLDNINDKYGEFVVSPALMMDMKEIVDRIAFGGIRDMDKL